MSAATEALICPRCREATVRLILPTGHKKEYWVCLAARCSWDTPVTPRDASARTRMRNLINFNPDFAAAITSLQQPIHRCGKSIEGPKVARHVVAWRKSCQRVVKNEGDRCWQHGGPQTKEKN